MNKSKINNHLPFKQNINLNPFIITNEFYFDDMETYPFYGVYKYNEYTNGLYRLPYLSLASIIRLCKYLNILFKLTKLFDCVINEITIKPISFKNKLYYSVEIFNINWQEVHQKF